MNQYSSIADATSDVRSKVNQSEIVNHPLSSPTFAVVVPAWTEALSGFEAKSEVSSEEGLLLEQIRELYEQHEERLTAVARQLNIGSLNEHGPARVLFMGLFRDLQDRFSTKQNLNPHKLAVLFAGRYSIEK